MADWTPEQQKEHRRLWVEALLSGKYEQARHELKSQKGGFCCLGVACEVSGLGYWGGDEDYISYYAGGVDDNSSLPPAVQRWLGLDSTEGVFVNRDDIDDSLAHINDVGSSFERIAEVTEAEPAGLVKSNEAA